MIEQEARALLFKVKQEYAGRITAQLDARYGVELTLVVGQLRITVHSMAQWQSMLEAWQDYLEPETQEQKRRPARGERPRHLVDGLAMYIFQRQADCAWVGTCTVQGKCHKRYFGKVDPRGKYPLVESQVKVALNSEEQSKLCHNRVGSRS